ncbi:RNA polymerase factor sigma-54 [Caulobacter sp. 17J80-11]|uniref:RNA polymerase factor sigma-54 n=1 Tax=Caulobacter sp. 17J80-11 TaxID=2763502 RepID=UPI001653E6F5|nr:RNA polymerase factor sigma-54 [Caulobacter sp. 17J80-11]
MALGARLELRQGQGLVITPQLQQAIKLLQLSNLELEAFVEAELERNPLLQRDESEIRPEAEDAPRAEAESRELEFTGESAAEAHEAVDARHDDLYADESLAERAADRAAERAAESAADAGPATDWSRTGKGGSFDHDGGEDFERAPTGKSLHEHLAEQALMAGFTPAEHAVALTLIDAVDEGGYLRAETAEIADRLGCPEAVVERVLERCQGFEPTGVMARSVPECLALQLKEMNRFDPAMAALVDHLELLARRDLAGLKRVCGVDDEDLREMIAELKGLTPRPGAAFGTEAVQAVVPDVFVRADPAGGWRVDLNSDTLPKLLVDQRYHQKVAGASRSDSEKTFVSDCLASANWLVKSLDQRARTILKVSAEIVRQQDAFLAFGVEYLRPLNLKTVADAIGMHESTVSRVTSNKYLATPRGVFELKFFFTSAIAASDGGAAHSAESVRHKIKQLIDGERGEGDVLSDDRIVEILKEAGVDIARRTVAKYREAMRIPSSVERKRLLKEAC